MVALHLYAGANLQRVPRLRRAEWTAVVPEHQRVAVKVAVQQRPPVARTADVLHRLAVRTWDVQAVLVADATWVAVVRRWVATVVAIRCVEVAAVAALAERAIWATRSRCSQNLIV